MLGSCTSFQNHDDDDGPSVVQLDPLSPSAQSPIAVHCLHGIFDPAQEVSQSGVNSVLSPSRAFLSPADDPGQIPGSSVVDHEGAATVSAAGVHAGVQVTCTEHVVCDHLFGGGRTRLVADHRQGHLPQEAGGATQVLSGAPTSRHAPVVVPEKVSGQAEVRQTGGDGRGAPDDRLGQVEQGDVAVKGVSVEVRMDDDLLDLYRLLVRIWTFLIIVAYSDVVCRVLEAVSSRNNPAI